MMSIIKWIALPLALTFVAIPAGALALLEDVKITKITVGFYGSNSFVLHVDPTGPGTGLCKAAGWVGFFPQNWPYSINTAGADTAQFDRIYSLMVSAYTTGQRITVDGLSNGDCNSSVAASIYP